jgi:hypothetical protein
VPLIALFPLPLFLPPSFFIFLPRSLSFSPSFSLPLTLALDLGLAHSPSRSPPAFKKGCQSTCPAPPAGPTLLLSLSLTFTRPPQLGRLLHTYTPPSFPVPS